MRFITIILSCVLAAGFTIGLQGCLSKTKAPPPKPPSTEGTSLENVVLQGTGGYKISFPEQGPRVWTAEAKTVKAQETKLVLQEVTCRMFKEGREMLTVTAEAAEADLQGKSADVRLTGKIHAVEPRRSLVLDADAMHWLSTGDTITANGVHWQGEGFHHYADRGEFSTDLTHGAFSGHIRTETSGFKSGR